MPKRNAPMHGHSYRIEKFTGHLGKPEFAVLMIDLPGQAETMLSCSYTSRRKAQEAVTALMRLDAEEAAAAQQRERAANRLHGWCTSPGRMFAV